MPQRKRQRKEYTDSRKPGINMKPIKLIPNKIFVTDKSKKEKKNFKPDKRNGLC